MFSKKNIDQYTRKNKAGLLTSGKPYFDALVDLIKKAKEELHLQVYIFEPDETGDIIKQALVEASRRGVSIYLLLDGFGSSSLSSEYIDEMKKAGIHFRWFGPLFSKGRFHIGRRMHYKVSVADYRYAIVGGINIGNRYNEINGQIPWYDFAVAIEGETAIKLHRYCKNKWKGFALRKNYPETVEPAISGLPLPKSECELRIRVNDQLNRKTRIVLSYRDAVRQSNEDIIIVGAYFLPGRTFIRLMQKASARGVKIILLTGARSDVWLAQHALHYLYRMLLKNKIEIYEYTRAPVHGKVIVADKKFVSLGSYDLNQLSSFINLELNIDILNEAFAARLHHLLLQTLENNCIKINQGVLKRRENFLKLFKQWLAFRLLRIMFVITLFISNKKDY